LSIIIIIIIIIYHIIFRQRTYNYIPETNQVFMVHNVAPLLSLKFMVRSMSFPFFFASFYYTISPLQDY